jgi:hypothetical protein
MNPTKLLRRTAAPAAAMVCVACLCGAAPAAAAAPALALHVNSPDTVTAGNPPVGFLAVVQNVGDAPLSAPLIFTDTFPAGVPPVEPEGGYLCNTVGQTVSCEIPVSATSGKIGLPGSQAYTRFIVPIPSEAEGTLHNSIEVSGGGAASPVSAEQAWTVGPHDPFAVKALEPNVVDADSATQAGSAPDSLATRVAFPSYAGSFIHFFQAPAPVEQFMDVITHVPPGLIGNPFATPDRCLGRQLAEPDEKSGHAFIPACPIDSQVGVARLADSDPVPLYNMFPPLGSPAAFGFFYQDVPTILVVKLRPDGGVDVVNRNANSSAPLPSAEIIFWGEPSDPAHDYERGLCLEDISGNDGESCPPEAASETFLRLPTSCPGTPLQWGAEADSYVHPGVFYSRQASTPAMTGCDLLPFEPTSISLAPTTRTTSAPTGLDVALALPQTSALGEAPTADLKKAIVTLPEGMTINPSAAGGLVACDDQRLGLGERRVAECPEASRIGSVKLETPLLDHPISGSVYLRTQGSTDPASGQMFRTAIEIRSDEDGVDLKLPGQVAADPNTGRLTVTFDENPQLPFSKLELHLKAGPRAPLTTPSSCGTKAPVVELSPWSGTEAVHPQSSFTIDQGCAPHGFAPGFEAGTGNPLAGQPSPFVLRLSRGDDQVDFDSLTAELPPGISAVLKEVPYCPDAALEAAQKRSGVAEQAGPSCPAASQVGSVNVRAGEGPNPFYVAGKAYLAGPYRGAPLSLAVVTPALAGPFDLGTVVVRSALFVDPTDAHVRIVSDPLPQIFGGVPLHIRSIEVDVDRPSFTLNPTSCNPMAIDATIAGAGGASANLSQHFQVGECGRLPFKPRLSLKLKGKTNRGAHPAFSATLRMPPGGTNIAKAQVTLPHSEFLDQGHLDNVCTRVQFAAEQCPQGSAYGHARAITPLLDQPLEGPVYLRSNPEHELPDLVADLRGQIHVVLDGRIDSPHGGIRNTFEVVPDAPVSKFTLTMQGGKKGLLQNSTNLCNSTNRATALFDGQSGKVSDSRPKLAIDCSGKAHRKGHSRHQR